MLTRATRETAAPPTRSTQYPQGEPDSERRTQPSEHADRRASEFPTLAALRERSTGMAPQHQQRRAEGTEQGTDEEMTESSEPGEPGAAQARTTHPSLASPKQGPTAGDVPKGQSDNASRGPPLSWHPRRRDRETNPSRPPRQPQSRGMGPLDLEELAGPITSITARSCTPW